MTEQDRLVAVLKGDRLAASNPKFWFMLQNIKKDNNNYQYYTPDIAAIINWQKQQLKDTE